MSNDHPRVPLTESDLQPAVQHPDKKDEQNHTDPGSHVFRRTGARRYSVLPASFPDVLEAYYTLRSLDWNVGEIDMTKDAAELAKLPPAKQHFIKTVLAFFAGADGIVMENIFNNFMKDVEVPEVRLFYAQQNANEAVHSLVYSLLIQTLIRDPDERDQLFRGIETSPAIKRKADWAIKWGQSTMPFGERLAAFACVEGIFFSGSFCALFWLRKQQILMPGLLTSNELIAKDEGMHTDFAALLYSKLPERERMSTERAHELVADAVEVEKFFITQTLPVSLIGMNSDLMIQYIQCVADRLLMLLGYVKLFHVENPFDWMILQGLAGKDNFFEKRSSDYQKANVKPAMQYEQDAFKPMEDF